MKLIDRLLDHAEALRFEALASRTVQASLTFITDSVGVALAGSRHPWYCARHFTQAATAMRPKAQNTAHLQRHTAGRPV